MFFAVSGVLKTVNPPNKAIIEILQVFSIEVFVPLNLVEPLKTKFIDKPITMYLVSFIRKNEFLELYGFLDKETRELFIKLNTLSKVGPKLALNILSVFSPEELRQVILEARWKELAKVPGIGPKRAEKLFLELKNLFLKPSLKGITLPPEKEMILEEAKSCLLSLGFSSKEIDSVLYNVFEEGVTLDELIKRALKELAPSVKEERFD
ncbi:Holliday junction branch migration protein RuvA [Thermodesulfobacterium thermophilum]|uniref:Holliday junction branch migration protein RuvA n=1 Tax=Thermodesulfobacterium thermophilum TaxID=886 RepID=UPI0003B61293|nr:Holliday junction branch migration protein RuvA [Thermodesulfobacterium thermophilum]